MDTRDISEALVKLSVSPVKCDQDAISRLEKKIDAPIEAVITRLDNAHYLEKAYLDLDIRTSRPIPREILDPKKIVACGLVGASIFGIASLVVTPNRTAEAITLGFVGSAALKICSNED